MSASVFLQAAVRGVSRLASGVFRPLEVLQSPLKVHWGLSLLRASKPTRSPILQVRAADRTLEAEPANPLNDHSAFKAATLQPVGTASLLNDRLANKAAIPQPVAGLQSNDDVFRCPRINVLPAVLPLEFCYAYSGNPFQSVRCLQLTQLHLHCQL